MENDGIQPFSPEPAESAAARWETWVERFEIFLVTKDIEVDKKKRAMMLHYAGEEVFLINKALSNVDDSTYAKLKKKLTDYFDPQKNEEYETFRFRKAVQGETESLDKYHARLRNMARQCDFHSVDREVKSQIIQTCNLKKVRDKGLSTPGITLQDLLAFGRQEESTVRQSEEMGGARPKETDKPVNRMNTSYQSRPKPSGANQDRQASPQSSSFHQPQNKQAAQQCPGCGGRPHRRREECYAWGKQCFKCGTRNHFARVCRSKGQPHNYMDVKDVQANAISENTEQNEPNEASGDDYDLALYHHKADKAHVQPYTYSLEINGVTTTMEVDTGAASSVINEEQFILVQKGTRKLALETTGLPRLRVYGGPVICPKGRVMVRVEDHGHSEILPLLVVPGSGSDYPNLLGRDWLNALQLDWSKIYRIHTDDFLQPYSALFADELGTLKGMKVKFQVDPRASPRFFKARPVPIALKSKVEAELDRLHQDNVIEPVEFADWAAPIVPVLKASGAVRICGDYKLTANTAVKVDKYPIPNVQDLYAELSGGQLYTKLDLSNAYQQLQLDEEAQKLTTINTSRGLFVYKRLPYGISAAPGIFQRTMEQLVQGIPMTAVYLDDILVTGRTEGEHKSNLLRVLQRLQDAGLRLKKGKCLFMQSSVTYLGHRIDSEGIHPTSEKLEAIARAPAPGNVSELRSYLGMLNYYHRFLQNLSHVLAPLHELLQNNVVWHWGEAQKHAFDESKKMLQSSKVLVHYDPKLPLIVSCDASPYGVGSVLSHVMPSGEEKPVAFASRSLTTAEKKYAQIEREGLSVVFGVTHFHKYLYGRSFKIQTDHQPLLGLLKEDRAISPMASARIQRWALTLSNYEYKLSFKRGVDNCNADGLSRLPLKKEPPSVPVPEEVVLALAVLDETPVMVSKVANWTARDPIMSAVANFVLNGWPPQLSEEFQDYDKRREELSLQDGCLLWGSRVIIPPPGRDKILQELHEGHPGMVRMKALARSYVWWPRLDAEIELHVKDCATCQVQKKAPSSAPLHPWEWPGQPWHRIHIDYAGPIGGKWILVIVDAHSKYIDAHVVTSTSSATTISKLRQTFATHGLPHSLVSDNAAVFTSEEFHQFCTNNGIKHIRSAPYHPSSNGLAERAVQTVKQGIKKISLGDLETRLCQFLARYRITPQTTTGRAPAELLMNRRPRSRLDLFQPALQNKVLLKQGATVDERSGGARAYEFHVGDSVLAMNFAGGPKWMPGVLEDKVGPVTFMVVLKDGRVWKRHQDHLRSTRFLEEGKGGEIEAAPNMPDSQREQAIPRPLPVQQAGCPDPKQPSNSVSTTSHQERAVTSTTMPSQQKEIPAPFSTSSSAMASVGLRRSQRSIKPPDRLDL